MDKGDQEHLSRLEKKALASGEWLLVRDETTLRTCFYNPSTHETTRDLARFLLLNSAPAAKVETSAPPPPPPPSLEDELKAARQLNAAYEKELAHLRHCLQTNASSIVSLRVPPDSAAAACAEEIRALRELTSELYQRIVLDRQQRFVCAVCCEASTASAPSDRGGHVVRYDDKEANDHRAHERRTQHLLTASVADGGSRGVVDCKLLSEGGRLHYGIPDEKDQILFRRALSDASPQYLSPAFTKTNYVTSHAPLRTSSVFPASLYSSPLPASAGGSSARSLGLVPHVTSGRSVAGEVPPGLVLRATVDMPPRVSLATMSPSPMRR